MKTPQEKVDELRKVFDTDGLRAGAKFLQKIFDPLDLSLMMPLILMRAGDEQSDDERHLVVETMDKYAIVPSLEILIQHLSEAHEQAEWVLRLLLVRNLNDKEAKAELVSLFKKAKPVAVSSGVMELFEKLRAKDPTHTKAMDEIIPTLRVTKDAVKAATPAKKAEKKTPAKKRAKLSPEEESVDGLRKFIDTAGLREGDKLLNAILDLKNPKLIRPLMLMREYGPYSSHHDEMWTVLHALEGYAKELLVPEIIDHLDVLAEKSPELLDLVLMRIANTPAYRTSLLAYLKKAGPRSASSDAMEVLENAKNQAGKNAAQKRFFETMLAAFASE